MSVWRREQLKHWVKRWGAKHLDTYMGGRGLTPQNSWGAEVCVKKLGADSVLEFGSGCWHFLRQCWGLGANGPLVGIESAIAHERVERDRPDYVIGWYCRPILEGFVIPESNKTFDVVYQCNSLPNLVASDIPLVLDELCRVGKLFVYAGDLRCRFWDLPGSSGKEKADWMWWQLESRCRLVKKYKRKVVVWEPK